MSFDKPQSPAIRTMVVAAPLAAALLAATSARWGTPAGASAVSFVALSCLYVAVAFSLGKTRLADERRAAVIVVFGGLALRAVFYALPPPVLPGLPLRELPAGGWPWLPADPGDAWARPLTSMFDLTVQVFLVLLLRARGESPKALFAYSWNPLVVLAVTRGASAGSLAGLTFVLAALLAMHRGRRWVSVAVWGLTGLVHPFAVLLHATFWNRLDARERRVFAAICLIAVTAVAVAAGAGSTADPFNASFWSLFGAMFGSPAAALAVCVALWIVVSFLVTRRRPPLMEGFAALIPTALLLSPHVGPTWGPWLGMLFVFRPSLAWMVFSGLTAAVLLTGAPSVLLRVLTYGSLLVVSLAQAAWHARDKARRPRHRGFSV